MSVMNQGPKGFGGWLILPTISLFVMPIALAYNLIARYLTIFLDGTWEMSITPGSEGYNHLIAPLIIFKVTVPLILIVFNIVLIFLFISKFRLFPKLYIAFLSLYLVFIIVDFLLSYLVEDAMRDVELVSRLIGTIISSMIWIPYFLISKRVKNTFIHSRSENSQ